MLNKEELLQKAKKQAKTSYAKKSKDLVKIFEDALNPNSDLEEKDSTLFEMLVKYSIPVLEGKLGDAESFERAKLFGWMKRDFNFTTLKKKGENEYNDMKIEKANLALDIFKAVLTAIEAGEEV